jgi:capsular polysaccharide export protein
MSSFLAAGGAGESAPSFEENWRVGAPENPAFTVLARARRVLLLQGPVGPFFDRVTDWLLAHGCCVQRVVFQGGDERDCQALAPVRFTGTPSSWPAFLGDLLGAAPPDCIVLFGQGRVYHKVALERARAMDLPVIVMEEGYFRPGFVTMELGGVNGYSNTLDRFRWTPPEVLDTPAHLQPSISPMHFQKMAWHASQHYLALHRRRNQYPGYEHHRPVHVPTYAGYWIRSWYRKSVRRGPDRRFQQWLFASQRPYYFVPLQLEEDTQVTQHSTFRGVAAFIVQVLQSFASHAPADTWLVLRQHPHARGGPGHGALIRSVASALGIGDRVHHLVEGDTPDLAQRSLGTVVINSTVGLQALERGVPLMVLGEALYRLPTLTFTGELDRFWQERQLPDPGLAAAFLAQVKHLTQMPASVYALRRERLGWPVRTP